MAKLAPLAGHSSRSEQVCEALREALLSGTFAPGQQMHESGIAAQLGVSKTPVREALSMLKARGLVESSPSRGIIVRQIDDEMVRGLYEVRELLEPAAVFRAVPNMDAGLLARAKQMLQKADSQGEKRDFNALSQLNRDFHELLYQRCGNSLMRDILNDMRDQLQFVAANGWQAAPSWTLERTEHEGILEAASNGDAEMAARLTEQHILSASTRLTVL